MGKWTAILFAALLAALLPAFSGGTAAASEPAPPADPLRFFAVCQGRAAAERAHREALGDREGASRAAELLASLDDLVDILTPADGARAVRRWRADARAAHSALLGRANLHSDAWAANRAAWFLGHCAAFVLPPPPSRA